MMDVDMVYKLVTIVVVLIGTGVSIGNYVGQVKRSASQEARIEQMNTSHLQRMDTMARELNDSRRENGVIIGCLYVLAGQIGKPEIKEAIEGMLSRGREK